MTTPLVIEPFERPDPVLTNKIVTHLKSQGIFDQFRRECMADVDTKPAYQNLRQRVEGSVAAFLKMNPWRPDMNKNQLRDNLRKHIQSGGFLDIGVDRIVDQVVNPKIYSMFLPKVEEVVQNCMGKDKDKPVFDPPTTTPEVKPEPSRFQNKHNLAPRARIPAPLLGPRLPIIPNFGNLKSPKISEDKDQPEEEKVHLSSPEHELADRNYVVDQDNDEENAEEEDDDEESPPFEHHSANDRLILGVRTDSSDSVSNDSQVVTTIVDDNLEERIDNSAAIVKEESDGKEVIKEDESSSDEYVPKTPTINMESSDGTVIEFNSISEYKQYQTKYDEESLQNVEEEVVCSQWLDESSNPVKEERNSGEDESGDVSRKRKLNNDNFDEASNSSVDKGNTSDEGKPSIYVSTEEKKIKIEEDEEEYETVSEYNINENEDSSPEKSKDMTDFAMNISDCEHSDKSKNISDVSKDSRKDHHRHHGTKDYRSLSHQNVSSKDKLSDKEYRESSSSSTHSSKEKKDHKKDDKHSLSRDQSTERDRKRSESSTSKHSDRDRSKHEDKDREKNTDRKKEYEIEIVHKEKETVEKDKKEIRHEHRDKSRDHNSKEKRRHDNHDKHSDRKQDHDKDKRDISKSSKYSHSSSRYSHKSSSEKHKSEKDQKLKQPSDKHTSHDKKSDKNDSRRKPREHCKSGHRDGEGRRSTDRDSNGPSGRSQSSNYSSSNSRSTTSRSRTETTTGTGDRTTSNSDNTVSDNVETLQDEGSKFDLISEPGIASPDPEPYEDSWSENNVSSGSEFYDSKGRETSFESNEENTNGQRNEEVSEIPHVEIDDNSRGSNDLCIVNHMFDESKSEQHKIRKNEYSDVSNDLDKSDNLTDDVLQNLEENICVEKDDAEESFTNPACSVHDTSSEKENIEQVNCKEMRNNIKESSIKLEDKEAKFKKPKIAANIFEVRKIMQARRNLKRMEKKRLKLLTNNNPDIGTTDKTVHENSAEKPPDESFKGFESVTCDKIEKYNCLIKRLSDELDLINIEDEINPNLITSLMDINPELDEYIENVLRGKVHRKMRVRLPPICHEYYTYDIEQNAYILTKLREDSPTPAMELVDNNLNSLKNVQPNSKHHITSNGDEFNHAIGSFNGNKPKSRPEAILENFQSKLSGHNITNDSQKLHKEESSNPENNLVADMIQQTIKMPAQLINDVIGIQTNPDTEEDHQRSPIEEDQEDQRHLNRQAEPRGQQRYNNSDLYKPRMQLSRRSKGQCSPDTTVNSPVLITRKRLGVTAEDTSSKPKRKR
uniref:BOD1/SHG1 domain-containing protein n=1 Tax=Graphocephala atropunctata TaxID=36148 RepID=A0A1B6KN32_9HEMI